MTVVVKTPRDPLLMDREELWALVATRFPLAPVEYIDRIVDLLRDPIRRTPA